MSLQELAHETERVDPELDDELPADRFLDRELSWLNFNQRVLELAEDRGLPLLERCKYAAIFANNLDEFFMVRVAGLKRRIAAGLAVRAASGRLPREVLEAIWRESRRLMERHAHLYQDDLVPSLSRAGIEIVRYDALTTGERQEMSEFFRHRAFPILTPLAVDPSHPFPYISGLSLNLAVILTQPGSDTEHFARVKVPPLLPRFVPLSEGRFVPLEDVLSAHLDQLFAGMTITQCHTFRVTRNEDLDVEEDDAENLLAALEKELLRRKFGPPVRLEVEADIDEHVLELLVSELGVSHAEVFHLPGPLDLRGLFGVAELDRQDLTYPAFVPTTHPDLAEVESAKPADMFAAIQKHDVLLHHPNDSFSTSVQRFLEQAAADPHVLAIKQTLYRTSGDSPLVEALIDAAAAGKQDLVVVEIKARFDESANIGWARILEQAGCHVVYGLVGLKTHCKLSLVVREEADVIRRYAHVGTGNYNPKTARQYEDLGLLTADPIITEDIAELFNHLSGFSRRNGYRKLLVAPLSVREGIIARIDREIEHARAGRPARVRIKANSIVDEQSIDALYRASRAGVRVQLWIRGICAVRPGVPGLSDNIQVRSTLGRFLEHSRVFWFDNDGDPEVGIGSADLMHRNLDRRVEVLVAITNRRHISEIGNLLDRAFDEHTSAWHLRSDGSWRRAHIGPDGERLADLQQLLITRLRRVGRTPVIPAPPPRGLVVVPDSGMPDPDAAAHLG
jgi:polyphosphate kinase